MVNDKFGTKPENRAEICKKAKKRNHKNNKIRERNVKKKQIYDRN